MEQNLVETQIDEHLMTIQRDTKTALERLERHGLKVDKRFLNYFLKLSVDRLTQTCERYGTEAKYKMSCTVSATMAPNLGVENITIPLLGTDETGVSVDKGDNAVKRKTDDTMNVESELLKRQKTMETSVNDDESGDTDQSQQIKYAIFYCVHCLNDKEPTKSFNGTFDDVSGHWLREHLDESICKPFQFYAVALLSCFYCKEVGTYNDLVKHHQERHTNKLFVIADRMDAKKCGMCHFKDGDLIEHFKLTHEPNSTPKLFNPIYYSEERIAELLTINVSKKQQCSKCGAVFETQDEIGDHFRMAHNGHAVESKEFIDNRTTPNHLICGYCHKKVNGNRYLDHLPEHTFNFRCTVCPYQSGDLSEISFHEKIVHDIDSLSYHCSIFPVWMKKKLLGTHMVYANGLVLKAYNALETKYDDSNLLDTFIQGYLDVKKERAKQLIDTYGKGAKLNGSPSTENWNRVPNGTNWNGAQSGANLKEIPNLRSSSTIGTAPPMETAPTMVNADIHQLKALVEGLLHKTQNEPTTNHLELNANQFGNGASERSNIPGFGMQGFRKEANPKSESSLIKKLVDQQKLAKNVYVQGICGNLRGADLHEIFLKLCKKMGVTICRTDIKKIDQCAKGITVKLYRLEVKKAIMNQTRDKFVWSNELIKVARGKKTWKIRVWEHMTTFYSKMWYTAMDLKEQHRLHAFELTEHGLLVQRTPSANGRAVLSEQELLNYVQNN